MARTAEECGFDGFFGSDHYLHIPGVTDGTGAPGPTDAWITLARLAHETSHIRLGTLLPGPVRPGRQACERLDWHLSGLVRSAVVAEQVLPHLTA